MKQCLQCHVDFKPIYQSKGMFCSRPCSSMYRKETGIEYKGKNSRVRRMCEYCGSSLIKKNASRYCSMSCSAKGRNARIIEEWRDGSRDGGSEWGILSQTIRNYLIKERGEKCEICGWNQVHPSTGKVPITIDHIDGDSSNHKESNLRILCPNCHSLTATYGGLNRGRGRAKRYATLM